MSTLISVTGISTKTQSSIDWNVKTGTLAFDTDDISSVIRRDAGNTYSYFEINPIKNFATGGNNYTKQEYRVSDSLTSIANQSTSLVKLTVTSRRGVTVSYPAVFVVSKMSQRLEVVPGGGATTRFWYAEDGDILPVEYIVSESIATIIAQTNSSFSFLVRNGISLNSGYIELGGTLIQNTTIDLDQYELNMSSSYSGWSSIYQKQYNGEAGYISDGITNSIGYSSGFYVGGFGFSKQAIDTATSTNVLEEFNALTGFSIINNVMFSPDILFRVNQNNPNGIGILESLPTYNYVPAEVSTDRVVGIKNTGEMYSTDILPSDIKKEYIQLAASDETTPLTAGTAKVTFRMPYAMILSEVRASLSTAQTGNGSGGIFTVDINDSGTTILSTKLTIDNTEKTSTTAATPAVISDVNLADDAEITIDVDQIGDGTAAGLKITLIGKRA